MLDPPRMERVAASPLAAVEAARELGGDMWVVKAQVHAGGRGKGGEDATGETSR